MSTTEHRIYDEQMQYMDLLFFLFVYRMLRKDKEEVEAIKHAKALEAEKAMYSVR